MNSKNSVNAGDKGRGSTLAPPLQQVVMAEPLSIQRLEDALDMRPFMAYARDILAMPLSSDDEMPEEARNLSPQASDGGGRSGQKVQKRLLGTKEERQKVKTHIYNFKDFTNDREWLYNVLLSDTETETEFSDDDDYVKLLLMTHVREQRHRENYYKKATNTQYAYYGAGFLANHDMFPEHQQSIVGERKRKRRVRKEKTEKLTKVPKPRKPRKQKFMDSPEPGEVHPSDLKNYAYGDTSAVNDDEDDINSDISDDFDASNLASSSGRGRRPKTSTPEAMAARRRRVWQQMAKKEVGRYQRGKVNNHKEALQHCKRVATMCMKVVRQRAVHSQKVMKDALWRSKRLTREMLSYWKRYERVERENRRRLEREAEEKRKSDVEFIEAKRQQRKLNFLITQTELYAHFMSKKLGQGTEKDQLRILNQLDEEVNPRLAEYEDDYNADEMKLLVQQNAEKAFIAERAKTRRFDVAAEVKEENVALEIKQEPEVDVVKVKADLPQPSIFKGTLKTYQIKGMTWLANLYDQGISGILADEMGLGKTVQSIAFLCHVAESYGVWGPFLIVSPASTLHNWQQEMQRFAPDFNVVPYWGSPNERKILRQFWNQKDLHTRKASFHAVITSYQLIVSDYKYFNRIKWQYMILDEAQAIKSSSSVRWKLLLGFNCRNRLLLSGTPIQNSMAELWALLHFIMPTLFDSHDEFNEWFSKDIESHAENKTGIDEKQISRLHMILKPFMLRRIKKDVENELSDKIEIMVYCPLTVRQKLLYMALKRKIRIEDLLRLTADGAGSSASDGHHVDRNFTSNLMNLVMQFRKVCNHPDLFERREAKSPFAMRGGEYIMPRLVFKEALLQRLSKSKSFMLYNQFSVFNGAHIQSSLFREPVTAKARTTGDDYARYVDLNYSNDCCFSFTRLSDLSTDDLEEIAHAGLIVFFQKLRQQFATTALHAYRQQWWPHYRPTRYQLLEPLLEQPLNKRVMFDDSVLHDFLFTAMTTNESTVYAFGDSELVSVPESVEHRIIRSKANKLNIKAELIEELPQASPEVKVESNLDVGGCGDESSSQTPTPTPTITPPIDSELPITSAAAAAAASVAAASAADAALAAAELLPAFKHVPRPSVIKHCTPLHMPNFLFGLRQRVRAFSRRFFCDLRDAEIDQMRHKQCDNTEGLALVSTGLDLCKPRSGWSAIAIPDKQTLVSDAGKLTVLDGLLKRLKAQGHRVLIYSQMTKMIDLLEEYMWHRKHRYMRLDGSSKISARRDMVADFQTREDIFVFLLSTRAGGLGINLTAADTVIFYDSDWNPTVDQQAMDRAHRLGQTKQVTVYRLICKGSIEERILERAREKSEIQRMVISGGNFKPDTLKPKEVVSLLLDDEEIEHKYRQKAEPNGDNLKPNVTMPNVKTKTRNPRRLFANFAAASGGITIPASPSIENMNSTPAPKRLKIENEDSIVDVTTNEMIPSTDTATATGNATSVPGATRVRPAEDSDHETLIVDCESPLIHGTESASLFGDFGIGRIRRRHHPRGTRRGRPRGAFRRGGGNGSLNRSGAGPSSFLGATTPIATDGVDNVLIQQQQKHQLMQQQTPLPLAGKVVVGGFTSTVPTPVKRGPGRPRLKTAYPIRPMRGSRGGGSPRTRKPVGPLVVPLGHSPAATPISRSPVISPAPSPAGSYSSGTAVLGSSGSGSAPSGRTSATAELTGDIRLGNPTANLKVHSTTLNTKN